MATVRVAEKAVEECKRLWGTFRASVDDDNVLPTGEVDPVATVQEPIGHFHRVTFIGNAWEPVMERLSKKEIVVEADWEVEEKNERALFKEEKKEWHIFTDEAAYADYHGKLRAKGLKNLQLYRIHRGEYLSDNGEKPRDRTQLFEEECIMATEENARRALGQCWLRGDAQKLPEYDVDYCSDMEDDEERGCDTQMPFVHSHRVQFVGRAWKPIMLALSKEYPIMKCYDRKGVFKSSWNVFLSDEAYEKYWHYLRNSGYPFNGMKRVLPDGSLLDNSEKPLQHTIRPFKRAAEGAAPPAKKPCVRE